ncbi:peptidase [Synechococcus phage S-CAM22]|uniref:Peptidase n=1 Tax=Synechococcus phage S-CAM22 TaxID=1883365 RepID=A0A1D8KS01_9CAUD|nr:peptidase [Synechococcus phage S-CAM22]YP_010088790.1 peptidase [Synechococcus phage S-CAM22]AOV60961.1 peptidase [Synechococcus phage S-CAM22]AOV61389.1 peptidase [Synechococcus phage S-CAM22]
MNTQEVKGTLAKLLATENLTVEHRKVSTACFDVEKRLLILPIWKTASNTVYDLLVGHEVGHALYTPNEDFSSAPKDFVNVLEDARIERMMKVTYPGLRRSFFEGYKQLWDQDFFGVKNDDPQSLSLIDRINLYFKGNPNIPFADEEMVWVNRAEKTKTFQDVVTLAEELYEFCSQKQDNKEDMNMPPLPETSDGEQSADQQIESSGDEEKEWPTESDPEEDHRNDRSSQDADLDTPSYEGGADVDETKSVTDEALSQALETLIDDNAKEWVYLSIPDPKVEDYIVPFNTIQSNLQNHFYDETRDSSWAEHVQYAVDHYNSFKKDTQKTVNYLCKQFEMKKSADEYRRAATSKTGVLDTNKLHTYKYNDDIFKKVTVIPEGKNHGLVMYLDWSGSMQHQLLDTLKQTYNLIWFCKKSGIPFRVYAFQSGYGYGDVDKDAVNQKEGELAIASDFRLFEFFSSRQNKQSLDKSMQLVYTQVFAMGGWRLSHYSPYTLGGTPLAEAVYCTRNIVNTIKRVERVSKVNVICLTDGEANPMSYVHQFPDDHYYRAGEYRYQYLCHTRGKVFFLRDPKTGYTRKISNQPYVTTKEIVSFYREITDYNWVGIRLCAKGELTKLVREFAYDEIDAIDKQWKKERFASIKNRAGFSESFYMPDKNTGMGSMDLEVKQKKEVATKAELTRAFKKHMGSKMTNKTILNAFIEQIA